MPRCRFYNKAYGCIPALREACIAHKAGAAFNTYLEQMAAKYEHDRLRADFWKHVMDAKISLISADELAEVGTSKQEAEAFLLQHTPGQQVLDLVCVYIVLHDIVLSWSILLYRDQSNSD